MVEGSKLWQALTQETFSTINEEFIENFRSPGAANKFVAWDPYEKSTRYLKFLLFTISQSASSKFIESYKKLSNVGLGNPIYIKNRDCKLNADYMAAVEEWEFLDNSAEMDVSKIKNIVEIGGGFGRTCHTLFTLFPNLESYTIIDLGPMLALSQHYLAKVIPSKISQIHFIDSESFEQQKYLNPDLVVNIDSFQEMPLAVIDDYMERIVSKGRYFYSKNAIGKYLPHIIGMPDLKSDQILDVFELGRCRDTIDIFNDVELAGARKKYLELYNPSNKQWILKNEIPMSMFPYFHHALYERI